MLRVAALFPCLNGSWFFGRIEQLVEHIVEVFWRWTVMGIVDQLPELVYTPRHWCQAKNVISGCHGLFSLVYLILAVDPFYYSLVVGCYGNCCCSRSGCVYIATVCRTTILETDSDTDRPCNINTVSYAVLSNFYLLTLICRRTIIPFHSTSFLHYIYNKKSSYCKQIARPLHTYDFSSAVTEMI